MPTPYTIHSRDQHLAADGRPKRILALDGGGLRGILSVGVLAHIERLLAQRHGAGDDFRLAHYFDLIAGTSTGAIIAAGLAQGMRVAEVLAEYNTLGPKVFERSLFRKGLFRAKYDAEALSTELQRVYGPRTTLGSPKLQTGLLVMTKRLDSGSPWPLMNNPRGRYYAGNDEGRIGNADYPLWKVVRASTAAPAFFDPETFTIVEKKGAKPVTGHFVDGGVSPFNNPTLQAVMAASLDGYRLGWPTGADKLLVVSVGTGSPDPAVAKAGLAAKHAVNALLSLMNDVAVQQQTMLQWMSSSPTATVIDRELGDLRHDLIAGRPLISYLRYDTALTQEALDKLEAGLAEPEAIRTLSKMDAPENMPLLHKIGSALGKQCVRPEDFAVHFDLPLA